MQTTSPLSDLPAHRLSLDGRRKLTVSGVSDIESFDETTVVLHTAQGVMIVRGEGLRLQMLSPESGEVRINGEVTLIGYEQPAESGGFFSRLFK